MFILLENHNDLLIYSKVIVSSCTSPNYNPQKKKKKILQLVGVGSHLFSVYSQNEQLAHNCFPPKKKKNHTL